MSTDKTTENMDSRLYDELVKTCPILTQSEIDKRRFLFWPSVTVISSFALLEVGRMSENPLFFTITMLAAIVMIHLFSYQVLDLRRIHIAGYSRIQEACSEFPEIAEYVRQITLQKRDVTHAEFSAIQLWKGKRDRFIAQQKELANALSARKSLMGLE